MAKLVLGKGLGALIAGKEIKLDERRKDESSDHADKSYHYKNTKTGEVGTIGNIPIPMITPNPYQPRVDFEIAALEELKQSLIEKGLIQPITVRKKPDGSGYELVSGERRLRAATAAGFAEIPAYVIEVKTNQEMIELALIENLQRKNLNPIEVALGYQRLADDCGLTQEEIAKKVSKDRTTVTNFMRLLKLPKEIQQSIRTNEISMGHARPLLGIEDTESQMELWRLIIEDELSVRKVEELAGAMSKQAKKKKAEKKKDGEPKSIDVSQVEATLRDKLATKIHLKHNKTKGSGEIVIEYYSNDDLERLIDMITNAQG
jgi:ParB family transcriptional regulator, chromosome partitioning protein